MENTQRRPRRFVGIMFECCNAYGRLYLNRDRTMFQGRCPRCYRLVTVRAAEDGEAASFVKG